MGVQGKNKVATTTLTQSRDRSPLIELGNHLQGLRKLKKANKIAPIKRGCKLLRYSSVELCKKRVSSKSTIIGVLWGAVSISSIAAATEHLKLDFSEFTI
jgi:hypothetical protein